MTQIDTSTEAVERLMDGVTPGPWRDSKSYRGIVSDSPSGYDDAESVHAYGGHMVCESVMDHNRPFIAAARDLIPALLKERDEARARVRALEEITDPDFIWGALDNVHDMDVTLDDYAMAVSRAQRAALAAIQTADPVTNASCRPRSIEGCPQMTYPTDDDLIRRGDAVLAVTAADKECLGANGAREFIRAMPAVPVTNAGCRQPVRVKPLVWVEFADRGAKAQAWNEANYVIQKWRDGRWELNASYLGYSTSIYGTDLFHSTIEAAKAAAQADYEARILSALEPIPVTMAEALKVQALVEAAQDAAEAIDMAYGADDDEDPHRHSSKLRAALAALKEEK